MRANLAGRGGGVAESTALKRVWGHRASDISGGEGSAWKQVPSFLHVLWLSRCVQGSWRG